MYIWWKVEGGRSMGEGKGNRKEKTASKGKIISQLSPWIES